MAGLTEAGFSRRTYDEILNDKIQKAKELFGEDINTDENTPLGKFIRINAYDEALISETMEYVYYSIFPNTATGASLDRLCAFVGITRNNATPAQYDVILDGTVGETVPYGFLIATESGIQYFNTQNKVIDSNGNATCIFECTQSGTIGKVTPDKINQIVETVPYISEISYVGYHLGGSVAQDTESDYSLRKRFESARNGLGASNIPSITSEIMKVSSVQSVSVIENSTDTTDAGGRPPHSFECYINSSEFNNHLDEIAEAIYNKKPIGIQTYGTTTRTVTDSAGNSHTIKFSQTQNVLVYVKFTITTDSTFGGQDSQTEIRNNINDYINTLGVGNDVILSQLYSRIYSVAGVKDVSSLQLSTDGSTWTTNNITVDSHKVAKLQNVTITVVT